MELKMTNYNINTQLSKNLSSTLGLTVINLNLKFRLNMIVNTGPACSKPNSYLNSLTLVFLLGIGEALS